MSRILLNRRALVRTRTVAAAAFLLSVAGSLSAFAQNAGSLSGAVQDTGNAQIPGAKVTVNRVETGEKHQSTTDGSGFYSFPVLLPGRYTVTIDKDGFSSQEKAGIEIFTGQATALNFALNVGQVQEKIQVSGAAAQLQTSTSSVTDVIDNKTIVNFPLLDRRATQLQRLNGFVVGGGTGSSSYFAIAGGRGNNANYTIDGGTTQNLLQGVATQSFDLPIDSLQEFSLSVTD